MIKYNILVCFSYQPYLLHFSDISNVMPITRKLSKVFKRSRRCALEAPTKTLDFLEDIGYFEASKSTYPNLRLSLDIQDSVNGKLILEGQGDEFETAYNKFSLRLQKVTQCTLQVSGKIWDAVANTHVQKHVKEIFRSKNIMAEVSRIVLSFVVKIYIIYIHICVSIGYLAITV